MTVPEAQGTVENFNPERLREELRVESIKDSGGGNIWRTSEGKEFNRYPAASPNCLQTAVNALKKYPADSAAVMAALKVFVNDSIGANSSIDRLISGREIYGTRESRINTELIFERGRREFFEKLAEALAEALTSSPPQSSGTRVDETASGIADAVLHEGGVS